MKTGTKLQAFTSRANTKQSVYIITHYFNLQHIKNGRNDTEYKKTCRTTGSFQSMASCMNRTFVVQMKAFQRNKPQSTIKTNPATVLL